MNETIYRALRKSDYPAIEALISNSFGLHRYQPHQKVLAQMKHAYLQSCLAEATYCRVAERGGAVVGVIMGSAKGRYRPLPHLVPLCSTLWHSLHMGLLAKCSGQNTRDYKRLHQVYHDFLSGRSGRYDGVLTLFAVDEDCRGLGIGRALLDGLQAYYRTCGVKLVYLYTDSSCNVGFYDSHGFSCADRQDLSMTRDGEDFMLRVFLYEKEYTDPA